MSIVKIYTDGACSGNPGPGGWAAIILHGDTRREFSGAERLTTNNRMELLAVLEGIARITRSSDIEVYSDSAYVVNAFVNDWVSGWQRNGLKGADNKPIKNADLWVDLLKYVAQHNVTFHKVKGHSDNELNNRCDELAVAAYRALPPLQEVKNIINEDK